MSKTFADLLDLQPMLTHSALPTVGMGDAKKLDSANTRNPPASDVFDPKAEGLLEPGTIKNLFNRPILDNSNGNILAASDGAGNLGSYSTTSSMSFDEDGKEVLVPTVVNGKRLTDKQAIEHYYLTGEHLGKFSSPASANKYAAALHEEQARRGEAQVPVKGSPVGMGDVQRANSIPASDLLNMMPAHSATPAMVPAHTPAAFPSPAPSDPVPQPGWNNLYNSLADAGDLVGGAVRSVVGHPEDVLSGRTEQLDTPFGSVMYPAGAVDAAAMLPLGGKMVLKGGKLVEEAGMPFFSQLAKTIAERAPNVGSAEQFLNIARKGSKAEELNWSGLEDYLAGKIKVSKADVLQHINDNLPQLQEKMMGAGNDVQPQFTKYTLPGGENHRELVVTMPQKNPDSDIVDRNMLKGLFEDGDLSQEEYDAALKQQPNYQVPDGHAYDDPELDVNRLLHARFNDRTTDTGEKALHMDELQSDWHQAGRKYGYSDANKPKTVDVTNFHPTDDFYDWLWDSHADEIPGGGDEFNGLPANQRNQYIQEYTEGLHDIGLPPPETGVPDAPFKNTWHELGMKRALQEAAQGGYDRLTWTTGAQQADRYSLAKHLDTVYYNPKVNMLTGTKGGNTLFNQEVSKDKLADYIGQDAADKLLSQKPGKNGLHVLKGDDLIAGGQGMNGFYDKMLPSYADKIGKKYGVKSDMVNVNNVGIDRTELVDLWKKYDDADEQSSKARLMARIIGSMRETDKSPLEILNDLKNVTNIPEADSKAIEKELKKLTSKPHQVHSIKITPEMRRDLMENGHATYGSLPPIPVGRRQDDDQSVGPWPSH